MNTPVNDMYEFVQAGGPEPEQYEALNHTLGAFNLLECRGEFDHYGPDFKEDLMGKSLTFDTMQGFAYRKPHGHAGDFELIERICGDFQTSDQGLKKWDEFWNQQAFVQAFQNSQQYFSQTMQEVELNHAQTQVLNVASGSSRSVASYLASANSSASFLCMDNNWKALDYARLLCRNYIDQVQFQHGNVCELSTPIQFDLVWSEGLFDYLNDDAFKVNLKKLLSQTQKGGCLVIGNLSTTNPSQNYMDFLQWHVNPRSEAHLYYLASCCGVQRAKMNVVKDPSGVNLFLHIAR
ncbi:MAG: extracellular factor (EF) 3-hydroxypalmitic acid methyl ester biosynthesis protein [Pseudohongiellaceae bacterium]|jgi:ubiquinone/menaquinone biosynthesis C-methylase UbiE